MGRVQDAHGEPAPRPASRVQGCKYRADQRRVTAPRSAKRDAINRQHSTGQLLGRTQPIVGHRAIPKADIPAAEWPMIRPWCSKRGQECMSIRSRLLKPELINRNSLDSQKPIWSGGITRQPARMPNVSCYPRHRPLRATCSRQAFRRLFRIARIQSPGSGR
jgi:hypothetical protein